MKIKKLIISLFVILLIASAIFPITTGVQIKSDSYIETIDQSKIIKLKPREVLPSSFSWRAADLDENGHGIDGDIDFSTPVKNQFGYPSCESFALTSGLEAMVQIEVGFPFDCDLSEAHLFFFSGGVIDWGSYPENDTKFLKEHGMPDEACWPYPRYKYQYPLNTTSPDWQERTVKISDWYYLEEDPIQLKTALIENGPIPTYFLVYDDFMYYTEGIYHHRWGGVRGPHYVCIMGYNDDPGYWIVKNSWGTNINDEGWFNIRYGECAIEKKSFYITGVHGQFPIAYVDDDNTEGPWNGSKEFPYNSIQTAINEVYPGYAIYVMNGTYNENLIVNKTVKIMGEDKSITIVNGSGVGDVITISEPNVQISGLTVRNSGSDPFNAGIKTLNLKSNATIFDNIIQENDIGLFLNYAYEDAWSVVKNNIIKNNREGIYAHWINYNEITENSIIFNSEVGLKMQRCEYSKIKGNIISDNGDIGIYLTGSSDGNVINGKNLIRNHSIGICVSESSKNKINGNNFIDNSEHQAYMYNGFLNKWKGNYWNDWQRFLPKTIKGHLGHRMIPYFNFDWRPKRNPVD